MDRPLRVLLDVNIFVSNIMAHGLGRKGTASQTLISMVSHHQWGMAGRSQLVVSLAMIDTLETVLRRMQFSDQRIKAYCGAILDVMRYGPEELDPYLILGGEEQFAMPDVEDAAVLATAIGAKADLIVTDNLRDFVTKDASVLDTQVIETRASGQRRLQVLRYQSGSADLVIAHPFDVMQWIRLGHDFRPDKLWPSIEGGGG